MTMIQQNQLPPQHGNDDNLSLSVISISSHEDTPSAHPGHVVVHLQDDPYYQDGTRSNAKIVALTDFLIAVLLIITLMAFITISLTSTEENNDDSEADENNPSKGDQLISISIKASFVVLLSCGIWVAILLLRSTKPTTSRDKSVLLTKYWLFYNSFVVILTAISIALLLMYKIFLLGWGGIGFLVLRLLFIGIVFRFWRELKSGGGAGTTTAALRGGEANGKLSLNQENVNFEE